MTTQPASLPRSISLQDIDMFSAPPVQKVSVVIPVYNEQESLPELALRLANQLKKMRRHQRYDAEQIVRDSGRAAGDEALFGPVLNVKVFD